MTAADDEHGQAEDAAPAERRPEPRQDRPAARSPISTNTKPLRTNPTIFQVLSHRSRLLGVRIVPEPAADDETGGDGREDAREAEVLGRQVRGERDDERDHDLDRRVVEPAQDLAGDATDDDADDDATDGRDDEVAKRLREDEGAAGDRERPPPGRRSARSRR